MTEHALSQHVTHLVRKLFGRKPQQVIAVREVSKPEQHVGEAAPGWPAAQSMVASRLQLIGLGRVKSVLGERWPKLAERVRGIAQTIIEKHLLPGDVFEVHGEDAFLVLFPQLSPGDARFKSDAICREIERRLIGENLGDISACIADIRVVNADEAYAGPSTLQQATEIAETVERNGDAQRAAIRLRRKADFPDRDRESAPPMGDARTPNSSSLGPDDQLVFIETPPRLTGAQMTPAAPPSIRRPELREQSQRDDKTPRARRHTDIEWLYRPVWDFKHSTLIMFALHPREGLADSANGEFLSDMDTSAVWKCVNDLAALSASGRRLPLLTQINFTTVDNARRRAFFTGTIRDIPPERRKLLSFEIVGCPYGGLNFGICSFISAIRALGVRIAVRVDPQWPDFLAVERAGAQIATMSAYSVTTPESEQMVAFEIFGARAANAKLEGALWGLGTRSLVVGAASAGVRYLSGDAVAEDIANLSHAVRFSPIDLYLQH